MCLDLYIRVIWLAWIQHNVKNSVLTLATGWSGGYIRVVPLSVPVVSLQRYSYTDYTDFSASLQSPSFRRYSRNDTVLKVLLCFIFLSVRSQTHTHTHARARAQVIMVHSRTKTSSGLLSLFGVMLKRPVWYLPWARNRSLFSSSLVRNNFFLRAFL